MQVAGDRAQVVDGVAMRVAGFGIQQHFQANALGIGHPGIVIAGCADYVGIQLWIQTQSRLT